MKLKTSHVFTGAIFCCALLQLNGRTTSSMRSSVQKTAQGPIKTSIQPSAPQTTKTTLQKPISTPQTAPTKSATPVSTAPTRITPTQQQVSPGKTVITPQKPPAPPPIVPTVPTAPPIAAEPKNIVHVTTRKEIDQYIGQGNPVIIKVSTEWCGPCKMMEPVFRIIASEYSEVDFLYLDADKNRTLAQELIGTRGYPTTIFYDANGKQLVIKSGTMSKGELNSNVLQAKGELQIISIEIPPSCPVPRQPSKQPIMIKQRPPCPPSPCRTTRKIMIR